MKLTQLNIFIICLLFGLTSEIYSQNRPFFNKNKDILIAQFDSKPDPDDIHAQAALGSMLAHSDLNGVKAYGVAGAIGRQNGNFIDSDELFDLVFGSANWTDADANWNSSVTNIKNKVVPILNNGGKVWVQEAGQSNITADWVAQVIQSVGANKVKNNVIVVQHSKWNQDQTTPSDLNYVKDKTRYFYIDDGNAGFNEGWGDHGPYQTPSYRSRDRKWIAQAKNSPNAKSKAIWREADRVVDREYPNGVPYDWSFMKNDGIDYSDCAENWWIFNIGSNADSVAKFWNRYVTNTTGSNPDPDPDPDPNPCEGKIFEEKDGVAAVEAEDFVAQSKTNNRKWYVQKGTGATPTPDPDPSHHNGASVGGYLEILPDTRVTHGDPLQGGINFSNSAGQLAIVDYKVKFNSPGKYFVWVRAYSTGTEDNGVHVGIDGNWPASGQRMQWCAGKNQWTWESKQRTGANHCGEERKIFINVPSAGVHTISFSMREDGFEMDKFVLSKAYNKPSGNGPTALLADCGNDNNAPQISITSPENGSSYAPNQVIKLTATASDTDGTILKVEFFANGNLIAAENTAPYDTTTRFSNPGNYSITARTTDNKGATTTSEAVRITIKDNTTPSPTSITIPGNFEAENYTTKSGTVKIENTPGTVSGKNLGFIRNGNYVDYKVNVDSSSEYTFDMYASSAGVGGKVDILESGSVVGSVTIPVTGQWHTYKKYTTTVSLLSGEKTLRLSLKGNAGYLYNIDKVVVTKIQPVEETVTLLPINDAFMQKSSRNNSNMIRIESNNRTGYLMFDLSSINGTITEADLQFTVFSDEGNGTIAIHKGTSNNWAENNLSNANKPSKGDRLGTLNDNFREGNTKTIPLKTTQISGTKFSLVIDALSGNDFAFASKENRSIAKPKLIITYAKNRDNIDTGDDIKLYPNPVIDRINFTGKMTGRRVKVFNSIGILIQENILQNGQNSVDVSRLPPGYYLVNVLEAGKANKVISTKKVIKQ